ncbi:MAG: DNA integrity scanning protein DisA nucleotide-binding domain protein [Pirellulaceae bacterium]|nr:DNA integrity scanning protein DisA nucleotide-binding domain protein [Pirellulaceae bacterium]
MKPIRFTEKLADMFSLAGKLAKQTSADALLVLLERPTNWSELLKISSKSQQLIVAFDSEEHLADAKEAGLTTLLLDMPEAPVYDKLTQALLQSVGEEILAPGATVVAIYSGFDADILDSISHIRLTDHLGRLTSKDLQQLSTNVPLDTLKVVVDLAIDIGREGREGKSVGTLFVVGDSRKVNKECETMGFDPMRGYKRKERDLHDPRVREGIKELAILDGAFIVSTEGVVERSCQRIQAQSAHLTLSKGLGTRHWAAAAISKTTNAISVAVSESNGTVRIFSEGEVILRIEPFRRAIKWRDFEYEPPHVDDD